MADPRHMGLVFDLSNTEYHATAAVSATILKAMRKSPAHGRALTDPARPAKAPSAAMAAGTLAHCALLEPEQLAARYAVKPKDFDGRTAAGKAWAADNAGREIVSAEQMQTALRQADAVRALPEIGHMLASGRPEVSAFWIDPATGAYCKCRPDWVHETDAGVVLLDLKTTQDASPAGFPRSIANYGYHLQDAHYRDGYEIASGKAVLGLVFVVVEADFPHAAAAYMLDELSLQKGRDEVQALRRRYVECAAADAWPAYPDTITPISLPAWAI